MLKIITGKPGSGKTYYAVHTLLTECDYDPIYNTYQTKPGTRVYCSMDKLRMNTQDIDEWIKKDGLPNVFNAELWEEQITKQYTRNIVVIDEAQRWFPSHDRTIPNSVWYWFEYHRHFGADVILMTQDASSLHRRILNIAENYVVAKPATVRLSHKIFAYNLQCTTSNIVLSRSTIKADEKVFSAYQSATHAAGLKTPKNYVLRMYAVAIVVMLIGAYGAFASVYYGLRPDTPEPVANTKKPEKIENPVTPVPTKTPIVHDVVDTDPYSECERTATHYKCRPGTIPYNLARKQTQRFCIGSQCTVFIPIKSSYETET